MSPCTANFEAQYGASKARPMRPDFDETFRMSPLCAAIIVGRTARLQRKVPRRLTSSTSSHSFVGMCATIRNVAPGARRIPAQLTRASMRPKRSKVWLTIAFTSGSLHTSSES